MRILTKREARAAILRIAARGSSSSALPDGRQQMELDTHGMIKRFARRDAVGRISTADRDTILEAIRDLNREGVLAGELNGYPLMAGHGLPARRAAEELRS